MFGHNYICPEIEGEFSPGFSQSVNEPLASSLTIKKPKAFVTGKGKFTRVSKFVNPLVRSFRKQVLPVDGSTMRISNCLHIKL